MMKLLIQVIRFALHPEGGLPEGMPWTEGQWRGVMRMAERQAVQGMVISGIDKMPGDMMPPRQVLMPWIALQMRIRRQNMLLYKRSAEVQQLFEDNGMPCCILKGQGNALVYGDPFIRMPGDVDAWVADGKQKVVGFIKRRCEGKDVEVGYHHTDFPIFRDVEVEVHHKPAYMTCPWHNFRMQRYYKGVAADMAANMVEAPEGTGRFAVPTAEFNAVFQLAHVFRHYLVQGIGLRQVIDYYYVIKSLPADAVSRGRLCKLLKSVGLYGFARAMMYVLDRWLGMDSALLIAPVDEKRGRHLIRVIVDGGNFGQHDRGSWLFGKGFKDRQERKFRRNWMFLMLYPSEALWEPVFRTRFYLLRRFIY